MATSPIYSWPEPDNTDLVKNGALAIRTMGDAIDTTMGTMVAKTIIDAKGDLIAGSAADTALRLAVGTNGQTLVADSTASTGLKWATPSGGGKVLQVVMGTTATAVSNSTTTAADTTLTATITPSSATSKVLVLVMQNGAFKDSGDSGSGLYLNLLRGATAIIAFETELGWQQTSTRISLASGTNYLDSPATTSATTYKTQFKNIVASASVKVQFNGETSTIILMEIGA